MFKIIIYFFTSILFISYFFLGYPQAQEEITTLPADFKCRCELSDVEDNTSLCFYVNFLLYNYFISGYSDGTYQENNQITRAEFSKFISNSFGLHLSDSQIDELEKFPDIEEENKFYRYIYSLKGLDIIHGYSDGNFKPQENVSRGQAAKFLANSIEKSMTLELPDDVENFFIDVTSENDFFVYIKKLYHQSVKNAYFDRILFIDQENYRPNEFLTRKEFAKMIVNSILISNTNLNSNLPSLQNLVEKIKPSEERASGAIFFYRFNNLDLFMLKTAEEPIFHYTREGLSTLKELALENDYSFAVNATYFGVFKRERPLGDVLDRSKDYVIVEGTKSYLRVRSFPSTDEDSNIVGKLYDFEIVEKLDENEKWFKIFKNEDSLIGWISKDFSRDVDLDNDKQYYWEYLHAGLLNYYGEHLFPIKTLDEDSQVTHIVRYDTNKNEMGVFETNNYQAQPAGQEQFLEFQTGPLMYQNEKIELEWINNSVKGTHKRRRSILVISEDKKTKYFILSINKKYSLNELVHIILNMKEFENSEPTIISLDGGSTVQFYSRDYPEFNFRQDYRKPMVFGFK